MRNLARIAWTTAKKFTDDDGWWIPSHNRLTLLMSLFAVALLMVLGPLILDEVERFAPRLAPHQFLLIVRFARIAIAALILAGSLFLSHRILPARRLRLLDLVPGVTLTFVCSIALGEALGEYLDQAVHGDISMDSDLASVMIALVYLYWVALLFVVGGKLNATIVRRAKGQARTVRSAATRQVFDLHGGKDGCRGFAFPYCTSATFCGFARAS